MRRTCILPLLFCLSSTQASDVAGDRFTHYAGFDLERTTLSEVQDALGHSRVRESGDAGEYQAWVCYSTEWGEVQFDSGEMGGGTVLLGITMSKPMSPDCPRAGRPLPTEIAGLRLGITPQRFKEVTGTDIAWDNDVGTATFEYKIPGKTPVDVLITVVGTFSQGRLVIEST